MVIPNNEMERVIAVSDLNLDYSNFKNNFSDLARLAAKIAGTDISLISVIDTYTQWIISNHGFSSDPVNREDTICQYAIMEDGHFEVQDLTKDERFAEKEFVTGAMSLRYYLGVPIQSEGFNIGTLCVIDNKPKSLSPEKIELIKIVTGEVVNRIKALKLIEALQNQVAETNSTQNKVAHDIRGPLSGIVGLAEYMSAKGQNNKIADVLEMVNLIHKSGNSILELADEILSAESKKKTEDVHHLDLNTFSEKLYQLYTPQAKSKNIQLNIVTTSGSSQTPFVKSKLLQIAGNLISNAIKFTPENGNVDVELGIEELEEKSILNIRVTDNGVGMNQEMIEQILSFQPTSTSGTGGEKGYGFGLKLVQHLIQSLNGTLNISSDDKTKGTTFKVELPIVI